MKTTEILSFHHKGTVFTLRLHEQREARLSTSWTYRDSPEKARMSMYLGGASSYGYIEYPWDWEKLISCSSSEELQRLMEWSFCKETAKLAAGAMWPWMQQQN